MKEASIHITKKNLQKVFIEMAKAEEFGWPSSKPLEERFVEFVNTIARRSKKYSINTRNIAVNNSLAEKKAAKLASTTYEYTQVFLKALYVIRRQKHRHGNLRYDESHKDWPTIKSLAGQLEIFCRRFSKTPNKGALLFVEHLFNISPKGVLNYWNQSIDKVFEYQEAIEEIQKDPQQEESKNLKRIYNQELLNKVGLANPDDNPTTFVHFVRASKLQRELGCRKEDFIKAQFEGLSWTNSYPEPYQLYGSKARERLIKYMYKNNIVLNPKSEEKTNSPKIDWKKLRKNK